MKSVVKGKTEMPEEHFKQTCHFLGYKKKKEEQEEWRMKKERKKERKKGLNNIQETLLEFQEHCHTVYLVFFSFKCAFIVIICEILSYVSHSCLPVAMFIQKDCCLWNLRTEFEQQREDEESWKLEMKTGITNEHRQCTPTQRCKATKRRGASDVFNCAPCHHIRNWG